MPGYIVTAPDGKEYDVDAPEGASHDEIMARVQQQHMSRFDAGDVAKSLGTGVAKGVIGIPGLPGDIASAVPWAADKLRSGLVGTGLATPEWAAADRAQQEARGMRTNPLPTSADIQQRVEQTTGPFYQPQTTAGRYAQTVGEFAPMAMTGPGSLARRAATATTSGITSQYAGEKTAGTAAEPWARMLGAVLGDPRVAAGIITPFPATAARQGAVDVLERAGVTDLTAGQRTGSFPLRKAESMSAEVPGGTGRAAAMDESAKEQFSAAALRTMGTDANRATPDVMAGAKERLGQAFEDLSARNNLTYDQQFLKDLADVHNEYGRVLPSQQREVINNYFNDIYDQGNGMSGSMYQDTRSRLSRQANTVRQSDPAFSQALAGMRDALDSAMGRSVSPQDRETWQTVRRQYANMKRVENAVAQSGELITPSALATAAKTGRRGQYVRGEGDLDELAQAGKQVMSPLPNSGTPAGYAALEILMGGMGGLGGYLTGTGGLMEAAAGASIPAATTRALMSRPAQTILSNQALAQVLRDWPGESLSRRAARAAVQTEPTRQGR